MVQTCQKRVKSSFYFYIKKGEALKPYTNLTDIVRNYVQASIDVSLNHFDEQVTYNETDENANTDQ